jgi:hypothetical protein
MVRFQNDRSGSGPAPATEEVEGLHFGCSMLRRTQLYLNGDNKPVMRCSLGYSIRGEDQFERCMAVEDPCNCWHLPLQNGSGS